MKPHTKYQRPGQEDFKVLPIGVYVKKLTFLLNMSSFFQTLLGPCHQCCILSPRAIVPLVPERKIFKGFLPYMGVVAILIM